MLSMMRKLVGILALLGILASPTVAQARIVCRYSGVEITDCEEQRVPERPVVQAEGCCERRVVPPLPAARVPAEHATVAPILVVAEPLAPVAPAPVGLAVADVSLPVAAGPPIYVVQRALLI
jgi:hypothetical protein